MNNDLKAFYASVLNNLGLAYWNNDETRHKSLKYYKKAYDIIKMINCD